jgi:glycosyltransferase involved in cell wall biosynthesis
VRVALVVRGGVDRSGRDRVIPALLWLVERLARLHDLHVFVLDYEMEPCTYPLLGATVHDLGRVQTPRGLKRRAQSLRLRRALRHVGGIDVVHAYWALPSGLAATAAARDLRVPCVVTADSGEWVSIPDISYGLQRRWIDRRSVAATMQAATKVTVCSQYMAALARQHGVDGEVIPLGVPRRDPRAARVDGPPWRLLHVASINRVKDHPTLLRAMRHLVTTDPCVHLDIVGEDTLGGAIQGLSQALGLTQYVSFHGVQPNDAVAAFFSRAHLHVVSSRHEAAGVVVLEAAVAGLPTVGTRVGYVADWAADDRAVAVPVNDAAALAGAMLSLLRDRRRRDQIASAARDWAVAHDADWTATQFDRMYRALTGR